jgi:hypothetical protein
MIFAILGVFLLAFFVGFFVWSLQHGGPTPPLYISLILGIGLTIADPIIATPVVAWIINLPWRGF